MNILNLSQKRNLSSEFPYPSLCLAERFMNMMVLTNGEDELREEGIKSYGDHIIFGLDLDIKEKGENALITGFSDASILFSSVKLGGVGLPDQEAFAKFLFFLEEHHPQYFTAIQKEMSKKMEQLADSFDTN